MKSFSCQEIASLIGGTLVTDSSARLSGIKPLDSAGPEDLSFLEPTKKGAEAGFLRKARSSRAGAILLSSPDPEISSAQIITEKPLLAVIKLASILFSPQNPPPGIAENASISPLAKVAENASIGAFCVVGDGCSVGSGTVLHPHVVMYPGSSVGENSILHSGVVLRENVVVGANSVIQNGAVVGGDGFGYTPDPRLGHRRIPHIGSVILEDGVDLGCNTTIDRGMLGETRIGKNTKIDNLVMVGHNNIIGERCLLCAQVGVSGSCNIGNDVVLAGQVGVADHLTLGNRMKVAAQTGIHTNFGDGMELMGTPALQFREHWKLHAALKKLPEILKRLKRLEKANEDETQAT